MLFSVVISTYNDAKYVPWAIESALAQDLAGEFEVIVVNDGSTDATREALAPYEGRVTVIHQANTGLGQARNNAIKVAKGRYIACLDSDDLWHPWHLRTLAGAVKAGEAQSGRKPVVVIGNCVEFFEDGASLPAATYEPPTFEVFKDFFTGRVHCLPTYTAFRTETFRTAGGYWSEKVNCEDVDALLRMGDAGAVVRTISPVTAGHRMRPGAMGRNPTKAVAGINKLLDREGQGLYPGGEARKAERHELLYMYARAVMLDTVQTTTPKATLGLKLWWRCLLPTIRQGKSLFAAAIPVYLLVPPLRPWMFKKMEQRRQAKHAASIGAGTVVGGGAVAPATGSGA